MEGTGIKQNNYHAIRKNSCKCSCSLVSLDRAQSCVSGIDVGNASLQRIQLKTHFQAPEKRGRNVKAWLLHENAQRSFYYVVTCWIAAGCTAVEFPSCFPRLEEWPPKTTYRLAIVWFSPFLSYERLRSGFHNKSYVMGRSSTNSDIYSYVQCILPNGKTDMLLTAVVEQWRSG